jgi:hypothetical protein
MSAAVIILLLLMLVFGVWTVIEGVFWLTVILVLAFIITGVIGGGLFSRRR